MKNKLGRENSKETSRLLDNSKLPPQALDVEEMVLGQLLLESHSITSVIGNLSEAVFYSEKHQAIFSAINSLYCKSHPIDILTVTKELRSNNKLELVGGPFYITQLTSRVASSANIEHHVAILSQQFIKREIIRISSLMAQKAYDETFDALDLSNELANLTQGLNEHTVKTGIIKSMAELVHGSLKRAKKREDLIKNGIPIGVSTGLRDMDKVTGGWKNGDLIIFAARPGMGKTAISLHFALTAATSLPVLYFSLEVTSDALTDRLVLNRVNVEPRKFKHGYISKDDWSELNHIVPEMANAKIFVDDTPGLSVIDIRTRSRVTKGKYGLGLIIIDYLQLMNMRADNRNYSKDNEVGETTRKLKALAKELDVPVIVLSQLNREVEKRTGKRPQLSDLRDSGSIEQDADIVLFAFRSEYYGIDRDDDGRSTEGVGVLIIGKHREGEIDDILFRYDPGIVHIRDYEDHPNKNEFN